MKSILDLSETKAYKFFMESSNYCSLDLPQYITFDKILRYVESAVGNKTLEDILQDKQKKPSEYEKVNYQVLIKKDPQYTYRPIQLPNPFLYYLLVRQITNKGNWREIKKRFKEFQQPNIEVASLPIVKSEYQKSHKAASILNWWEEIEQKSISLSVQYKYMFTTDITDCYKSIYTHSIAWALMGKDNAKIKKGEKGYIGNIIDTYMQGMQYGQTNGIPQGSVLFDFIAEMVLGYADLLLSQELANQNITEFKILRYRDDYRIFSNKREELERIAFSLQSVLAELNFQLNTKKTFLTENIIENSLKADKAQYLSRFPLYKKTGNRIITTASSLQQEALYLHSFSKEFPNSGTLTKLLTIFSLRLQKKIKMVMNATVLIAIFTDIALYSPKTYKNIIQIISQLIPLFHTTKERKDIIRSVYDKFQLIPNIGELQVWLQRLTYQMPDVISFSEPICKIIAKEGHIKLWNNDWVGSTYENSFPYSDICTNWLVTSFTPIIDIDEVSLFEQY